MPDSRSQFRDYYRELDVSPDASGAEIQNAWRAAAKRWHPDTNRSPDAVERMKRINEAREVLSDPRRRAEYDRTYQQHRSGSAGQQRSRSRGEDRRRERTNRRQRRENERHDRGASAEEEARRRRARQAEESRSQRERQERMQREAREQARREREAQDQARRERAEREAKAREQARREREAQEQARRERAEREARAREQARRERGPQDSHRRATDSDSERIRADADRARREHARQEEPPDSNSPFGGVGFGLWLAIGAALLIPFVAVIGLLVLNILDEPGEPTRGSRAALFVFPTPTSTPMPAPTAAPPTAVPAPTPTIAVIDTATPRPTATPLPTLAPLPTATPSPIPTSTPLPTATPIPTATSTPVPTATATPVPTSTAVPTATAIPPPTATPTVIFDGSPTALHAFLMQVGVTADQVRALIDAGAPVTASDTEGRDPLEVAAEIGLGADILSLLIERGADPRRSPTILHMMLKAPDVRTRQLRVLVDAGASTVAEDARGIAPLEVAVAEGLSASILRFLVFNGAMVSHAPTILHALLASDAVTAEHVQVLLDAGVSESKRNALGQTPLDIAIAHGLGEDILSLLR